MRKPFIAICGAAVMAVTGSGCVSMMEYDDLKARYSAQAELNQKLKEDIGRENANLKLQLEKQQTMTDLERVRVESKDVELAAAKAIADEIRAKLGALVMPEGSGGSEGSDIEYGRDFIRFSGEVLFDSGKTELKAQGKQILLEVAKELKSKGLFVRVDGHTDSDPIKRSLGKFPTGSNFELGAERALSVLLMLQKEGGIDAGKLHMTSWGEHQPAENGNKRKNRRVEIRFSAQDPYVTEADAK
ncbi:MAG: chemotaxis protein [Planctomycetota bacterium]|nr:MAG: chemotaxis protein [Planctomycetota bacterium]